MIGYDPNYNKIYYQKSRAKYRKFCQRYNDMQITIVYRDYLYDHLQLSQAQARIFHHFVWLHNDENVEFAAPEFRGVAGMKFKDNIPDFLNELKAHLEIFKVHFRKFYFDRITHRHISYALHIDVDNDTYRTVDFLVDWNDTDGDQVEWVPLSPEPIALRRIKRKKKSLIAKHDEPSELEKKPEPNAEPEPKLKEHMQGLIDYLNGRQVCYNLRQLAKKNKFDLDGQKRIVYKPKIRTDRFFSNGKILNHRWEREQLFHGCIAVDISHAQLSIVAKLWDLPKLTSFFESDGNIWDTLMKCSGLNKGEVKEYIYSAVYGMDEQCLNMMSTRLRSHELIEELIAVRDAEIGRIMDGQSLITAFGDILTADSLEQATSILSILVQSYEQMLVLHAFNECFRDSKDAVLMVYLFDGFYFKFSHNHKHPAKFIERVERSISDKGKELGMLIECDHSKIVDDFLDN